MDNRQITWEGLAQMMVRALRQLGDGDLPCEAHEWINRLSLEVLIETEQTCRYFLLHGDWPQPLSEETKMLLRIRCLFVLDCILSKIHLAEDLRQGTAERRLTLYFFEQWLRDWPNWIAQRNPNGTWNFPLDPWNV